MDLRELRERSDAGTRHPWEVARAMHVKSLVQRSLGSRSSLLDVGSGDSYVALSLLAAHPELTTATCVDINYSEDDLREEMPDGRLVRTAHATSGTYEILLLLDVIEHVQDSTELLRDLRERSVHRDAFAVITVPAHQGLFSEHDHALGHHRRYSIGGLRRELEDAGWDVKEVGAFFMLPLLARLLEVKRGRACHGGVTSRRKPPDLGQWQHGPWVTAVVRAVLQLDVALGQVLHRCGLRTFGLSLWAVATPRAHV